MCVQKNYEKALEAKIKYSKKQVKDRKSIINELVSFGQALCKVVGRDKDWHVECELQDIPPLPSAVATVGVECDGYMLVLIARHKEDCIDIASQNIITTVLSCWFSPSACFPCEIRANEEVYKCINKTQVVNCLMKVAKGCLVSILAAFDEGLRMKYKPPFLPKVEGSTGNVEPIADEPSACNPS